MNKEVEQNNNLFYASNTIMKNLVSTGWYFDTQFTT